MNIRNAPLIRMFISLLHLCNNNIYKNVYFIVILSHVSVNIYEQSLHINRADLNDIFCSKSGITVYICQKSFILLPIGSNCRRKMNYGKKKKK